MNKISGMDKNLACIYSYTLPYRFESARLTPAFNMPTVRIGQADEN